MATVRTEGRARAPVAVLSLIVTAAVWGVTFPIVRNAVSGFPPLEFLAIRFLFASAVLIPILWKRSGWRALIDRSAVAPGICLAIGYALQTEGLRTVGSSVSAFLTGTSVVLVAVLGRAVGWERPGIRGWGAVLIALAGIYLLEGRLPDRWSLGETMTACCAVAFACQILIAGRVMSRRPEPLRIGAGQILVATLILCAAAAARHSSAPLRGFSTGVAFAAILTGLLATAGAFVVQMWAQRIVSARRAAICFAAEPLFAALFATALYGETMSGKGWLGAASVLVAILLVSMEIRRESGSRLVEEKSRVC